MLEPRLRKRFRSRSSARMARAVIDPAPGMVCKRAAASAQRYRGLIEEFTGGNKDIENSLANMYRQEPDIAADHSYTPDPKMAESVGKALQA